MTTIHGYEATRAPNGDLTVHDVPIFLECQRDEFHADEEWLKKAFAHARRSHKEGYFPPLHVWHHEYGVTPRRAGHFELTRLGPQLYRGKDRLALFAALTFTDGWAQEDLLARRLPYRSVEIYDPEKPEINSLALLDTEPPYIQLPMLTVTDVSLSTENPQGSVANATFRNPWHQREKDEAPGLVVCFSRGARPFLLTEEPEDMATAKNKPGTPAPKTGGKTTAKTGRPVAFKDGEDDEEKDGDGENMEDEGSSGLDVDGVCAAVESGEISVADMEKLLAAIQARMGGGEEEPAEDPDEVAAPAMAPGGESMSARKPAASTGRSADAERDAEIIALRARLDERDAADQRREDVDRAMARFEGKVVGSSFRDELETYHKAHKGAAFKAFVDALASKLGAAPDGADSAARFSVGGRLPKEVEKFQALGADAVARATALREQWEHARKGGSRVTCDDFLDIHMRKLGFSVDAES